MQQKDSPMSSMIRKLYNQGRHIIRKEETIETGVAGITGFALGYMSHKSGGLDRNGIPIDALGGVALMYGHMIPGINKLPFSQAWHKRTREVASSAIAVGMARVGERTAAGGGLHSHHRLTAHHGEGGLSGSMAGTSFGNWFGSESGQQRLVRAAAKL
jgi:hypothetical protein